MSSQNRTHKVLSTINKTIENMDHKSYMLAKREYTIMKFNKHVLHKGQDSLTDFDKIQAIKAITEKYEKIKQRPSNATGLQDIERRYPVTEFDEI